MLCDDLDGKEMQIRGDICIHMGFPGGSSGKEPPANAGDGGLNPWSGRSLGEGNGHPLQYSCLGNPMDKGAWWVTVHEVPSCWT